MAEIMLASALALLPMQVLHAVEPSSSNQQRYEIPAKPLTRALADFARISGVDILYENSLAMGRVSAPVSGAMSPQAALRALLQGTGLSARFTGHRAAIVFRANAVAPDLPSTAAGALNASVPSLRLDMAEVRAPTRIGSPDPAALQRYAQTALTRIRSRLAGEQTLRNDVFRLSLAVTIEIGGRIDRVAVIDGSGRSGRDELVRQTLTGFVLPPPPRGLNGALRFEVANNRLRRAE